MSVKHELSADDLRPLVAKLSQEERVRLAYYALSIRSRAAERADAMAYQRVPVGKDEFSTDGPDPMAWEAEGWEDLK